MAAGSGDLRSPPRRGVGGAGLEIGQVLDRPPGERLVAGAGGAELRLSGNDMGDARVVLGRRADVEIDPERSGDLFGRELQATVIGVADEIAAAASLVMGEAAEGTPVAIVRGATYDPDDEAGIGDILRPLDKDLFR